MNSSMKKLTTTAVAFVLCALSVSYLAPAAKANVTDCLTLIGALAQDVSNVAITGQNAEKDRAGLESKLSAAAVKVNQVKLADAVQKLNDFVAKVQQLAAAGRISATDAQRLITEANNIIACINSLG